MIYAVHKTFCVLSTQSTDMPRGAVNDLLKSNHYRIVPRLASQQVFDDICPPSRDDSYSIQWVAEDYCHQESIIDHSCFKRQFDFLSSMLAARSPVTCAITWLVLDVRLRSRRPFVLLWMIATCLTSAACFLHVLFTLLVSARSRFSAKTAVTPRDGVRKATCVRSLTLRALADSRLEAG